MRLLFDFLFEMGPNAKKSATNNQQKKSVTKQPYHCIERLFSSIFEMCCVLSNFVIGSSVYVFKVKELSQFVVSAGGDIPNNNNVSEATADIN